MNQYVCYLYVIRSLSLFLYSMDGVLDFIDTADMTLMNRQEHTKVTDLAWDSTGRYVVSSLSYWTEKVRLYNIYSIVLTIPILLCRWTQDLLFGHFKENSCIAVHARWKDFVSFSGDPAHLQYWMTKTWRLVVCNCHCVPTYNCNLYS